MDDEFKIANRVNLKSKERIKSAVLVQLTRNKTKQKYNLVRFFDRELNSKNDIPAWGGLSFKEDFNFAFGINPRLKSALAGQALYQPAKFDFTSLFSALIENDRFQDPNKIYQLLLKKAKTDKSKFGIVIMKVLSGLLNNNSITIPNGAIFGKEINIYVSEFIVPLMIALNRTDIQFSKPVINIGSKSNQIGYDAEIKDLDTGKIYLISVKQGGIKGKHGAYGSIAFIAKLISEKRSLFEKKIENFELFEKLLSILLGNSSEDAEDNSSILNLTKRKTYRNLILIAKKLSIDPIQIDNLTSNLNSSNFSFEQKIENLNKFALKVYESLNQTKWFKDATKIVLETVNFIQARLISSTNKLGDLQVLGVEINTVEDNEIDFSAKKSYFGNKLATGHGGFLLKEIEEES
ncbi:MAG TPA: hypothetical protein PLP33_16265 [Leptospiraceae bacterium]|nr:hypothetical protein [Leptospiraceae bacterium]